MTDRRTDDDETPLEHTDASGEPLRHPDELPATPDGLAIGEVEDGAEATADDPDTVDDLTVQGGE
ncbi:MAG: hypothetical protein PGN23_02740 [Sphingomonas adhaesiva]|uniref:hypothetical protein n=1 Tax=Sphingomonas adhaesiva TaxID=28212 RepID=UPI002FF8A99D